MKRKESFTWTLYIVCSPVLQLLGQVVCNDANNFLQACFKLSYSNPFAYYNPSQPETDRNYGIIGTFVSGNHTWGTETGQEKKLPLGFSVPLFLPLWPFYCSCLTAAIKRNIGRRVSSCHSEFVSSSSCVGCGSDSFVMVKPESSNVFT